MNRKILIAMLAATAFTGLPAVTVAEEKPVSESDVTPAATTAPSQESLTETTVNETPASPQVVVQSQDKFLSEMKVYPSF